MTRTLPIICLMGPTCSGKTDLALCLYERFPLEIISVDSVMVYRGMDIGTAKPSQALRTHIPHQLIDIRDPKQIYSVGDFCSDASGLIASALQQGKIPFLVGGTMLYFNALQQGLADLPTKDAEIRQALMARMENEGLAALYAELCQCDAIAANRINNNDPQRIIRALEVYQITGKPLSYWWQKAANTQSFKMMNIGLMPERISLPHQIAQRFHQMLEAGFIAEVQNLFERGDLNEDLPAIRSVGYKQAWKYLAGKMDYATMVEKAIIATRQLAKRQFTWLRSWSQLEIVAADDKNQLEKVTAIIRGLM